MAMNQLSTESSCLLQQPVINEATPQSLQERSTCSCKHLCIPSKAAILMIFWAAVVGAVYNSVILVTVVIVDTKPLAPNISISANDCLPYAILALVTMFYPLSGFIADVCCGRFKTVVIGLCFILAFVILMCLVEIVMLATKLHIHILSNDNYSMIFHQAEGNIVFILVLISLVAFVIGLAGYQANVVQLGLDQLFEAPSQYLSLFILYAIWAFKLGSLPLMISIPLLLCSGSMHFAAVSLRVTALFPIIIAVLLIILLILSWWRRHWFYTEAGQENPYKTVFKIINFARKHKHPLQRSAFTFSDNYIPSRVDFAKERYGGPFTTEQVENVKTFFRILIVLFAVGPIFTLEVPASYFIFPLFGFHTLQHNVHLRRNKEFCTGQHTILGTGVLMYILSMLVLFPIYIVCITHSVLRKKVLKLFKRISIGAILCLLGVSSLVFIDIVGHSLKNINISNHTQCMFQLYITSNDTLLQPTLDMHWSVLIPPSLFFGVGPLILMTATLEFISAQSPQSMKGLLIGLFFAIRGLFQFLNSIIIIPFSLKHPWASGEMLEHPPVTNCGFIYLLFTCVVGLIGLILFSVAAKKYKYRARNAEDLFRQADIEEIYDRYITQASMDSMS